MWPQEILPRFNEHIFENHMIGGIISQLNPSAWYYELQFEHDSYEKSYILNGVMNGFCIVNENAAIQPYKMNNYSSVLQGEGWNTVNESISVVVVLTKVSAVMNHV